MSKQVFYRPWVHNRTSMIVGWSLLLTMVANPLHKYDICLSLISVQWSLIIYLGANHDTVSASPFTTMALNNVSVLSSTASSPDKRQLSMRTSRGYTWLSPGNRTWQWTIPIGNDIFPLRYVRVFLYIPKLVGGFSSSEKWWSSSVGMMTFHIYQYMESHNPVMFQSPPTSHYNNQWIAEFRSDFSHENPRIFRISKPRLSAQWLGRPEGGLEGLRAA